VKIGVISAFPPVRDGIADYSFYLVKSMEDVCNDCTFYVMAPLLDDKPKVTSCSERVMLFRIWRMKSVMDMLKSIILIIKVLFVIKADILHIQYRFTRDQGGSAGEPFFILMFVVKKILRKPKIVVSLHDFWLPKEAEQRAYEIMKSKMGAKLYKFYYAAYVRAILNIPDLIISIVNSRKSPVTECIKKYTRQKVVEVLHGLPHVSDKGDGNTSNAKHNKEELGISDKFIILLFGFVRKAKGYHHVIKAVKKIGERQPSIKERIKVMLVGIPSPPEEQSYLNYVKKLVHKLDLDDVVSIITKYLSKKEIDLFFRAADITVISYTRRVGPSGILSFALAYEVPSIITCDEKYITHETSLPTLKVNLDIDEIASAILKLMTDEDEHCKQIRRIRKYKAVNSNRKIALLHIKLYEKLCSEVISKHPIQ